MKELQVIFDSIQDIEQFVRVATKYPGEVQVIEGHRILDGKAILGLLSLGTKQQLTLSCDGNIDGFSDFLSQISDYLVS